MTHTTQALELADRLSNYAATHPARHYWIEGRPGDDTGEDYCRECAEAIAARDARARVCGPAGFLEADTCRHCEACGELLDYALTRHGVESELAHYQSYPPAAPLSRGEAFHVARMAEGVSELGDDEATKEAVIKVARAAVAMIQESSS